MSEIEGNSPFATSDHSAMLHGIRTQGGAPWRCRCDRTANSATRICRRPRRRHASARTNARSAPIALNENCTMSARTAAAASRPGRSGRRGNGGRACRSTSGLPPTSACICITTERISPRIVRGSGISIRRSGNS